MTRFMVEYERPGIVGRKVFDMPYERVNAAVATAAARVAGEGVKVTLVAKNDTERALGEWETK